MYVKIDKIYNQDGELDTSLLKFVVNVGLNARGNFNKLQMEGAPEIVNEILLIDGVESIEAEETSLIIKKNEEFEWGMIKPQVLSTLLDFVAIIPTSQQPLLESFKPRNEMEESIEKILMERIAPAIRADGGDIEFRGVEDGIAMVRLSGACVGCPSAPITLKDGIERVLKHYFPGVLGVRSV